MIAHHSVLAVLLAMILTLAAGLRSSIGANELQSAIGFMSSNQAPRALALLSDALKNNASDQHVAEYLMSTLQTHNFPILVDVSNAPKDTITWSRPPWKNQDGSKELKALPSGNLQIFDSLTALAVGHILPLTNGINSACFSPDNQRVATLAREIAIWDVATGQPLSPLLAHRGQINSIRFSPNGLLLLSGSCDSTAQLWDGFTGRRFWEPMWVGLSYVVPAEFSSDGARVIATSGNQPRLNFIFDALPGRCLCDNPPLQTNALSSLGLSLPAPDWLPELIEAVGGMNLTSGRFYTSLPWEQRLKTRKRWTDPNAPAADPWSRWVKWFFADRSLRPLSPTSSITIPEYVKIRIEENTVKSLKEALLLDPNNAVALARLARQTLQQDEKENPRRKGEAVFYSLRALTLAPNHPEVRRLCNSIAN